MQLNFDFSPRWPAPQQLGSLLAGPRKVPVTFVRNRQAKRYILRVSSDGAAHVTIPRAGSRAAALDFASRHRTWIEKQLEKSERHRLQPQAWTVGSEIYYRGDRARIEMDGIRQVRVVDQVITVQRGCAGDLRPFIERHFWQQAARELNARTLELAGPDRPKVRRVVVRNQRARWGSCSMGGTISLNWRLLQTPHFVRDYLIVHELMHLKEMNHSPRFWKLVKQTCPAYRLAEEWLNKHAALLR